MTRTTPEEYKAAVQRLIDNATEHSMSSTGERSAQILCALYNSRANPAVDLCGIAVNFDDKNLAAFITVMNGFKYYHLDFLGQDVLIDRLRMVAKPKRRKAA